MQSLFDFIITPKNERYDNKKYIDDSELLLNTEISDHRYVSRTGIVTSIPKSYNGEIKPNDEVILHHNVFRRWYDIRGNEKNSAAFLSENDYIVSPEEVFAYKRNNKWHCFDQFCFVKPIKQKSKWEGLKEKDLQGVLVYSNNYLKELGLSEGDVVGFKPDSEYEFNIDGQKLYRILSNYITTNYVEETKSN